jgi:hypothetical protein
LSKACPEAFEDPFLFTYSYGVVVVIPKRFAASEATEAGSAIAVIAICKGIANLLV